MNGPMYYPNDLSSASVRRLVEVYESAYTVRSGKHETTVNELTDQRPAARPDTLMAAANMLLGMGPMLGNKLLSEEDKGAVLAGLVSVSCLLPLAMARVYPYEIPGSVVVPTAAEYFDGSLVVNGIEPDDEVTIIDDTLSTGGTIISLANAIQQVGARLVEVRVVVEKLGFGGRRRIEDALGVPVRAAIGVRIEPGRVRVEEIMEESRSTV